jgi:pimeloyl-ACP methyl ester carboxylesterase
MKPTIVLIHGMWSTGSTLAPIRAALEGAEYTCHSPTLPHHEKGGNATAVATMSHLDYVAFLENFVHGLNLPEPPIFVGHSMGGLLAQLLAVRIAPKALVLFAPAAPAGINALNFNSIRATSHALLTWKFWQKSQKHPSLESAQFALFNGLPLERQKVLYDLLVPESGKALFEAGFAMLDKQKATHVDFSRIQVPVLMLHGTDDHIVIVEGSRQLLAKYKNIELKEYVGSGHWLFEESTPILEDTMAWLETTLALKP